jgi:23S rRNA (guanosine2251-2'-O)-methyltransferase
MAPSEWIYGLHAVAAALRHDPASVQGLWVERRRQDARRRALLEAAAQQHIPVHPVERTELDRLSGHARHQGVLVRCRSQVKEWTEHDLPALLESTQGNALLLVLDGVQDPHNLGACLRSADAAGVQAVLAPADRAVGLTPTVRKVACGATETVPFIQVGNLARSLRGLQEQGLWLIGAAGEADKTLYEMDFTGPVAVILGAEEKGLRRLTRDCCDHLARIPMAGSVKSLNVSVATGIFLFEAIRQRQRSGKGMNPR